MHSRDLHPSLGGCIHRSRTNGEETRDCHCSCCCLVCIGGYHRQRSGIECPIEIDQPWSPATPPRPLSATCPDVEQLFCLLPANRLTSNQREFLGRRPNDMFVIPTISFRRRLICPIGFLPFSQAAMRYCICAISKVFKTAPGRKCRQYQQSEIY